MLEVMESPIRCRCPWRTASRLARLSRHAEVPRSIWRESSAARWACGRRLRYTHAVRDLRHVHEAVGQFVRFGCRGGSSPVSPLRHSRGFRHHYLIFPGEAGTRRVASGGCRLSWDGLPSFRLVSGALGLQRDPRSLVSSSRAS